MERLLINSLSTRAIDDFLEYRRIVGEDDGGTLFTPEQYESYKKKVIPQRMKNRLYVSYGVPGGMDCKLTGPETLCFCTHRYKQHQTHFEVVPCERPLNLPCQVRGCRCVAYQYVPLNGSQPVRCRCKHSAHDHKEFTIHLCTKCSSCIGFQSPYTCGCGQPCSSHRTLVETREEREARGRPTGRDVPYAAMGALTGFSSLADGYLRLDDSGAGAPQYSLSPQPYETVQQHVFEKAYGPTTSTEDTLMSGTQNLSNLKTREEEDMAYFEKQYQARLKAEKMSGKQRTSKNHPALSKPSLTAPCKRHAQQQSNKDN